MSRRLVAGGGAPGSLIWVFGSGLSDRTEQALVPLRDELAGIWVQLGTQFCKMAYVSPDQLRRQIPWDFVPNEPRGIYPPEAFDVLVPSESRFEATPTNVSIPGHASFLSHRQAGVPARDPSAVLAIRQDWKSYVTEESPARPGEILHFYATGLGSIPPRREVPQTCSIGTTHIEVLYGDLAPDLIGIYQITLRMPQSFTFMPMSSRVDLRCGIGRGLSAIIPATNEADSN